MKSHAVVMMAFVAASAGFAALSVVLPRLLARYRRRFTRGVSADLGRSFVFVDSARLFAVNLVLAASLVLFIAWLSRSVVLSLLAALSMAVLPRVLLWVVRRRRRHRFRHQVPELLNLVAGGLRAGHGLNAVLGQLAGQVPAPASQELALIQRQQRMGIALADSLAGLERRMHLEETVLLVAALRLGARTGGDMACTLDSLADAVRRKLALEGKVRALTAQGRLQAWVMGCLPVAMIGALAAIEPDMFDMLTGSTGGWIVCGFVFVSELIGITLIRRIVAIDI